jgi:hypothetical protein
MGRVIADMRVGWLGAINSVSLRIVGLAALFAVIPRDYKPSDSKKNLKTHLVNQSVIKRQVQSLIMLVVSFKS